MIGFGPQMQHMIERKLSMYRNIIRENDGKQIETIDGKYAAWFCEDRNGSVYAILLAEDGETVLAATVFFKVADNCLEFNFGYVRGNYRGQGLGEKLVNSLINHHRNNFEGKSEAYISMGLYGSQQTLHVAKKLFEEGKYQMWLCRSLEEVSDETEILSIDDCDEVLNDPYLKAFIREK